MHSAACFSYSSWTDEDLHCLGMGTQKEGGSRQFRGRQYLFPPCLVQLGSSCALLKSIPMAYEKPCKQLTAHRICAIRRQMGQRNLQSSTPEPSNLHMRRRLYRAEVGRSIQPVHLRPPRRGPSRLSNVSTTHEAPTHDGLAGGSTREASVEHFIGYRHRLIYHGQSYL